MSEKIYLSRTIVKFSNWSMVDLLSQIQVWREENIGATNINLLVTQDENADFVGLLLYTPDPFERKM